MTEKKYLDGYVKESPRKFIFSRYWLKVLLISSEDPILVRFNSNLFISQTFFPYYFLKTKDNLKIY
jgi:hypothetical protein